ncbi:AMP-binding protein [Teredinibacter turnerae]|uniref:AMP-binding protein n=1 Tax=Teredinibacter turnerae TaxID=2426 RepID=UPI00036A7F57|nr:AMP-binding protein [Teredinibacter turnerae]
MTEPSTLLCTRPQDAVIAHYRGQPLTVAGLVATAESLAATLEPGCEVINLCGNRVHFLIVFCAVLLRGGKSILPPNRQPGTIVELANGGQSPRFVFFDEGIELGAMASQRWRKLERLDISSDEAFTGMPRIPLDDNLVEVYTSGSTGVPKKLVKTWRILAGTGEKLCAALDSNATCWDLVATVPCQHMYGLEASVIVPLRGQFAIVEHTPFYPEDVVEKVAQCERPVRLVTTPVHLRAVVQSHSQLPASLQQIISATAPLAEPIARAAEDAGVAEVYEIFGFSEAGSVATRRTLAGPRWQLLRGFRFEHEDKVMLYADHLPKAEPFPDELELVGDSQFRFLARAGDHLNIGGKRMSLADLSAKLLAIPGVVDAHLYIDKQGDARPVGFVVTDLSVREVLHALSHRVDPVFLPRPFKKVPQVMRNATGKVTAVELAIMLKGDG